MTTPLPIRPFVPNSPLRMPSLRVSAVAICVGVLTAACGTDTAPQIPPPIAALQHPEVVRLGTAVEFDARSSMAGALRNADGVLINQAALVTFRFLVADGSAEVEVTTPRWSHTFSKPGLYAIGLTVEDDLGRTSTVRSQVHVTQDYTSTCTAKNALNCTTGQCLGDVCAAIACADQSVCTGDTTCALGACYVTPPAVQGADVVTGADVGATGVDTADRQVP